jgi:hypothetical protein
MAFAQHASIELLEPRLSFGLKPAPASWPV